MHFRNFLRGPSDAQTFGAKFREAKRDPGDLRRLVSGLARQLSVPYHWPETAQSRLEDWENPEIPSGYTYLAQLVAHDCVFTSVPTGALSAAVGPARSRRSSLLRLETIYGHGPDSCPHAYAPRGTNHLARNQLALSELALRSTLKGRYLSRDIARTGAFEPAAPLTSVQVADPRNDVHAALSQITTLFISLHNKIASMIEDLLTADAFPSEDVRNYRVYFVSRAVCESIYRAIVRDDLLPRILHRAVVDHYGAPQVQFLDSQTLDALPLEFANAFRFGHAMVRPFYVFNDFNRYGEDLVDMMLSTSAARPWRMPLDDTWMAQWSHFFEIDGSNPNLSRRIGPEFSGGLFSGEVFGAIDETGSMGLGYRDLLNGAFVGTWSVAALADELRRCKPELASLSPLLVEDQERTARIRSWLSRHRIANGLSEQDVDDIASDPPLLLYVLFEAADEMAGKRLGILGSILVAETLYKALLDAAPSPRGPFEDACEIAFGKPDRAAAIEKCTPGITTMAGLISYVAEDFELEETAMPFV
jgi:hypothetical protein